jgi:hypothetical protein
MQCSKQRSYSAALEASKILGSRIVKVDPRASKQFGKCLPFMPVVGSYVEYRIE